MLEVRDLVLKPGARPIGQRFEGGRIHVVLGGNHSGKTQLCRVLAGLAAPESGEILIGERHLTAEPPGRRPVALVYQAFVNYPHWTVAENIASPLVAAGAARPHIEARVDELAARVALDGLLDRYPHTLSGGQQQRLAIARALAKSAAVLVLDEPLVNLDYKLREALELELRGLLHEIGTTVIYTSSDPREAFALADELLLLDDHAVLQSGPALAVYEAPVSITAADLMSDPRANRAREGATTLLVRPEHLALTPGADDDLAFGVEVMDTETNGSETFLHCRLTGPGGEALPVEPAEAETLGPADRSQERHWLARLPGLVALPVGTRCELFAARTAVMRFAEPAGG
jgi:glycerol transport system ATP-binding protein